METPQEDRGNNAARHVNALQEINVNPMTPTTGISQLPIGSNIPNGDENLDPGEPEKDGIRYSENTVPAEADDNSDQDDSKPAAANIGVELQENKKKRKKKSKSKRGMVTCSTARGSCGADLNHRSEGQADGIRGVLCGCTRHARGIPRRVELVPFVSWSDAQETYAFD